MLLERNQTIIGFIAVAVIALGTFFAVQVTRGGFVPGLEVKAEFEDAAGLEPRNFVFVAGVRAGQVSEVEIVGDHVEVTFKLNAQVPDDSTASIVLQNALGKRAIRVEPGTSTTFIEEGFVFPVERTSQPVDFPELGDETVNLLAESDVDALQGLVTAVADVTEGNRQDVVNLIDGVDRLTQIIADRKDDLEQVIQRAEVLVDAAADKDREIVRVIDSFGQTLDMLARRRADVTRLLRETAVATDLAADLVEDERARINRVLTELDEDLQILDSHQVELAHAMAYAGTSVWGFANIGYGNGTTDPNEGQFTDNTAPPHDEGFPCERTGCGWGNILVTGLGDAGVAALVGCGGPVDAILTGIFGPDPTCDTNGAQQTTASVDRGPARTVAYRGLEGFFTVPGGAR